MSKLIALSYSPWSEKARWALDHRAVPYVEAAYVPMIGELGLRATTGRWTGRVTVPVLVTGAGEVLTDSFDIARYAERVGSGAPLFPPEHEARLAEWNARSDEAMAAARGAVVTRLAASPAALLESLPKFARNLGPLATALGRSGVRFFQRKYDLTAAAGDQTKFRSALDALRAALAGGRPYVLDRFTYADISAAVLLQAVVPVDHKYIRLGRATRATWTDGALASEYADLVTWRDGLYARHRHRA
jgi:glutathione S-transferase